MEKIFYSDKKRINEILEDNHLLWEEDLYDQVDTILRDVRKMGYQGVATYTKRFDGADLDEDHFRVSEDEFAEAFENVDDFFIESVRKAIRNVEDFHRKQLLKTSLETDARGVVLGQMIRPLERVGLYVPGGTAAYPSSVIMTAIPGKVAGVESLVMITPPGKDGKCNPYTLVAASLCGVDEVYKVGGAQGVGALAYGAGPLEKVDKIVGPGNIYVTIAKKIVYGTVDIDMLAGPSEILVIADEDADPDFIAADLLSQGEHDKRAAAILVATDEMLVDKVLESLKLQLAKLSRREIAEVSLENRGAAIVVEDLTEALEFANVYGPEHLELAVKDPLSSVEEVKNAGAVFLGYYTPEPLGDYFAGPNHVLPTTGTARFYSPLNTHMYLKKTSVIGYTREALIEDGPYVMALAEAEGLDAHRNAVAIRMNKGEIDGKNR